MISNKFIATAIAAKPALKRSLPLVSTLTSVLPAFGQMRLFSTVFIGVHPARRPATGRTTQKRRSPSPPTVTNRRPFSTTTM